MAVPAMRTRHVVIGAQLLTDANRNCLFSNVDVDEPRHLARPKDLASLEFKLADFRHAAVKRENCLFRNAHWAASSFPAHDPRPNVILRIWPEDSVVIYTSEPKGVKNVQ